MHITYILTDNDRVTSVSVSESPLLDCERTCGATFLTIEGASIQFYGTPEQLESLSRQLLTASMEVRGKLAKVQFPNAPH